jgi:hypothetical protein
MQDFNLRQLDQRTIAVELTVQGQKGIFKGLGEFESDGKVGPALRIKVAHPLGDFEVLLKESQWDGQIESGEQFGCDFALSMSRD